MSFVMSLLAIEITGIFFTIYLFRRFKHAASGLELVSLSFFVGLGAITLEFFFYYFSGISFSLQNLIIFPLLSFVLLFSRYAVRPEKIKEILLPGNAATSAKWTWLERLLVLGIVAQILWIIFLTLPYPVISHDAVANYALKAKIFHFGHGIPGDFFKWGEATVAHPDYPLMLPLLMTWVYAFTGFNDSTVMLIMPVIYVSLLALFYSQLRGFFERKHSLLLVFLLATIPQLADYATIIHADLLLTAFISAAAIYFFLYVKSGKGVHITLASILFGFSLWTKNEAVVFAAAFLIAFTVLSVRSKILRRKNGVIMFFAPFFIVSILALPQFLIKFSNASINSDLNVAALTPARLWQNVKDIPMLLNLFQQEVFGPKKWNIFWVLFFAAMIWKRKKLWKGEVFYVTLFLSISAVGYLAAYMSLTGKDLYFYVNTTISRFMLHFTPLALFFASQLLLERRATSNEPRKYIFLDRDGVINKDPGGWTKYGYVTCPEDFLILDGVLPAIKKFTDEGYKCVIISNQQGVGKGYLTVEELDAVTSRMKDLITKSGGTLAGVYYCPHL